MTYPALHVHILNKRLASGWRANPVTQGVTLAINTQLVIASLRCAPQAQGLQGGNWRR